MRIRLCLTLVLVVFYQSALAEKVYKCTGHDGKVVYQMEACSDQQQAEQKAIDPNHNTLKMELPPADEPKSNAAPAPLSAPPSSSGRPK